MKSVTLGGCRRINVLIGRPNVGKSNILEALALFDVPYMVNSSSKSLKSLVRVENVSDMFHNGLSASPVKVVAEENSLTLRRSTNNGLSVDIISDDDESKYSFTPSLNISTKKEPDFFPEILTYFFPKHFVPESSNFDFLLPPRRIQPYGDGGKFAGIEG